VIVYLDTSALLKLFIDEPDARVTADLLQQASATFTHLITYAEVRAALAKAVRMQRITDEVHLAYKVALESYWENIDVISLNMSQTNERVTWLKPMGYAVMIVFNWLLLN